MFNLPVNWPAPNWVGTFASTRLGGVSEGPWFSLNLGNHVGDDDSHVNKNRQLVELFTGIPAYYLRQIHSSDVILLDGLAMDHSYEADAAVLRQPQRAAVVMTADCMPLLFCHRHEKVVAVAHAGWRGLAQGVIGNTVRAMTDTPEDIMVWIGPTISQAHFEVGQEVKDCFVKHSPEAELAFLPGISINKWQADLELLARQQLESLGIKLIYGGNQCNYSQPEWFFSHRRDQGITGRMGYFIWIKS